MVRTLTLSLTGLGLVAMPAVAFPAELAYVLSARVPVYCVVRQQSPGVATPDGAGVSLGQFREYCNAPNGYELVVRYAPGSLRGATLTAGLDSVVLNGSGEAVLSRASGPRVISRTVVATPGAAGFDTDRLELALVPQ